MEAKKRQSPVLVAILILAIIVAAGAVWWQNSKAEKAKAQSMAKYTAIANARDKATYGMTGKPLASATGGSGAAGSHGRISGRAPSGGSAPAKAPAGKREPNSSQAPE
jgi:hypothetical protein